MTYRCTSNMVSRHLTRGYNASTNIVTGMNDVLPKPFTKEGLLAMLEKHLSHLKKGHQGMEPMPPPLKANNRSLKSEDSPATSPATGSNWNSPNQLTGGSPSNSNLGEEPYVVPAPYSQPVLHAPSTQMYAPAASGILPQHVGQRRPIDNITGGPEMTGDAKRQHMYTSGPMGTLAAPPPHMMQRPPR